jgi:hypothetical protein
MRLTRWGGAKAGLAVAAAAALTFAACGGSPSMPSPSQGGSSGGQSSGPTVNNPPAITSIAASTARAEVDTDVTLTAVVEDAETPVSQLKLEWTVSAGVISGQGTTVTWHTPTADPTPKDYTVTLTVTETYGTADAAGVRPQQSVTAQSPVVRVHNSPKELGDLSVGFLTDFANSSIPAATCVRDFSDTCKGKADELGDITANREDFDILASSLRLRSVKVASSQVQANMTVACSFTSRVKKCPATDTKCVVGSVGTVAGDCTLTGVYEQKRWWLCDSHFSGTATADAFRSFFKR